MKSELAKHRHEQQAAIRHSWRQLRSIAREDGVPTVAMLISESLDLIVWARFQGYAPKLEAQFTDDLARDLARLAELRAERDSTGAYGI